jgi:ATP/maltotriose-dependent transcriptional regulator MalT
VTASLRLIDRTSLLAATGEAGGAAVTPGFTARAMADHVLAELDDASGITLVIDDLHEITSADSRAALAHLLTNLPAEVHAILATRHDPRLAAISLDGHPDPERFVAEFSGSDRAVAEYLLGEMLDRRPEEVRRLLLCTSLLDRVNGELPTC